MVNQQPHHIGRTRRGSSTDSQGDRRGIAEKYTLGCVVGFRVSRNGGAGLTYPQTRSKRLRSPTTGVRLPATSTLWEDDVAALALLLAPGAAFSHLTAAQLHGLAVPCRDPRPLHVTVPRQSMRGTRKGVRWHLQEPLEPLSIIDGVPVTALVTTWRAIAPALDLPRLTAITDQLLRRGVLGEELTVPRGCRGAVMLRKARRLADPRSLSVRESMIRVHFHSAGFPPPELNYAVVVDGIWIGTGDFVWPEYRVYLEYDGGHHGRSRQRHQDALTRNELADLGWTVRVLTDRHFRNLDRTIADVAGYLRRGGWSG